MRSHETNPADVAHGHSHKHAHKQNDHHKKHDSHHHLSKKLTEYIMSMYAQGYDEPTIRSELKKAGHDDDVVDAFLTKIKEQETEQQEKEIEEGQKQIEEETEESEDIHDKIMEHLYKKTTTTEKTFASFYFLALFVLIIITSISTMAPVVNIFVSFLPAILTIMTIFALFDTFQRNFKWGMFIIPFIWCGLFYYLGVAKILPMYAVLDIGNISVLNFLISVVFIIIVYAIGEIERHLVLSEKSRVVKKKIMSDMHAKKEQHKTEKHHESHKHHTHHEHHVSQEEAPKMISEYIQSIEDKSKALNFVIGRVYSQRNGGTPEIRNRIKILSEWYNEFSHLESTDMKEKLFAAQKTLSLIYERLIDLKRSEKELFGRISYDLKNLDRDEYGRTKVIDVLVKNDNDPVKTYYKSALEFCTKAMTEMKKLKIDLPHEKKHKD